jgi:hypothetical protein
MRTDREAVMKQALDALDTAEGLCQLIEARIAPTDLPECRAEILSAQRALAEDLGMIP